MTRKDALNIYQMKKDEDGLMTFKEIPASQILCDDYVPDKLKGANGKCENCFYYNKIDDKFTCTAPKK